ARGGRRQARARRVTAFARRTRWRPAGDPRRAARPQHAARAAGRARPARERTPGDRRRRRRRRPASRRARAPAPVARRGGGGRAAGSMVDLGGIGKDRGAAEIEAVDPRDGMVWYPDHRTAEIIGRGVTDAHGVASLFAPASTAGCLLRATGAHVPLFVDAPALSPAAALRVAATAGGGLRGRADLHGELAEPLPATLLAPSARAGRPARG